MKHLILSLLLTVSLSVFAASKGVDATISLSPAGSFHATTSKIKGKITKKGDSYMAKKLYVKVKDLKTGIDLRDDHLQKRLLPKKHSKIVVSNVKAKGGKGKAVIEMKGIKKPIKFTYNVSGKIFSAKFKINLKQFKIKDLTYAGVGAEDEVEIEANVPVK